jgi:hypothetical protein
MKTPTERNIAANDSAATAITVDAAELRDVVLLFENSVKPGETASRGRYGGMNGTGQTYLSTPLH